MSAINPVPNPLASSPCIGVCAVDGRTSFCLGCGRQLKEIAGWSGMSEKERRDVMAALPPRIETLGERATDADAALARIKAVLGEAALGS